MTVLRPFRISDMQRVDQTPYNEALVITADKPHSTTIPSHMSLGSPWRLGRGKGMREDYSVAQSFQKIEPLGAHQQFQSQKAEEGIVDLRRMVMT